MSPRILLAPMEGVVDHQVRDLLTRLGGIDGCVTEFVRVVNGQQLPNKVFLRFAPELAHQCLTPAGIPVKLQLLGGDPETVADNAQRAVAAGALAIDLNFGCPAKSVNKSDGGACLLREPERVHRIVHAVRSALPRTIPVSAKIRLGYEDRSRYLDNARAVAEAAADELVVHARSKADGYKPPAYWEYIAEIQAAVPVPVVANGEIWSLEDYLRCRAITGCRDVMIGRGLLANPDLGRKIQAHLRGEAYQAMPWPAICTLLYDYFRVSMPLYPSKYGGNRIKQWLMYLRLHYPQAQGFFERIKRETTFAALDAAFQAALQAEH